MNWINRILTKRTAIVTMMMVGSLGHVLAMPRGIEEELVRSKITRVDTSLKTVPPQLKVSLRHAFREKTLSIADKGQPFRKTDVVDRKNEGLPTRRFALGFGTSRLYCLYYESGGMGLAGDLLVFAAEKDGSYRFVWGGVEFAKEPSTPQEVIRRVRRRSFDDSKPYIW
jgi:hypothetical protein